MFNGVSCEWLVFIVLISETDCPPLNCASACRIAIFKIAFFRFIHSTQHSISCQLSNSSFALLKSINYKWNAIRMLFRTLPIKVPSIQNQSSFVRMWRRLTTTTTTTWKTSIGIRMAHCSGNAEISIHLFFWLPTYWI